MNSEFGSLEVFYTYPSDTAKSVELLTNIQGLKQFHVGPEVLGEISVLVTSTQVVSEPVFIQVQTLIGGTVVDQSDFSTYSEDENDFRIRIFFFDKYISVNLNDKWVYSYAFAKVSYIEDDVQASIQLHGATTNITAIRRVELADGREAVYVDYESNTENAIQSIIQQRPVLVQPTPDRELSFTYKAERDTLTAGFVYRYREEESIPSSLSSDGLVYGSDVSVSIDLDTARDIGFITRLYRLPELTTGATSAAGVMQKRARESRTQVNVEMRLDPRVQLSDVLHVDKLITGTNRVIDKYMIVEGISIGVRDGDYTMTVTGRKRDE